MLSSPSASVYVSFLFAACCALSLYLLIWCANKYNEEMKQQKMCRGNLIIVAMVKVYNFEAVIKYVGVGALIRNRRLYIVTMYS